MRPTPLQIDIVNLLLLIQNPEPIRLRGYLSNTKNKKQ